MPINKQNYEAIINKLGDKATLVAVSKIHSAEDIMALYDLGQRDFGENYVQELVDKEAKLPKDIRWHFIGHLQSNKVKYIAPFVHLIQGVDSLKLLQEINRQASKNNRVIPCLLQMHIASEETKFGFDETELRDLITQLKSGALPLNNVLIDGLMGMASFTDDLAKVDIEFGNLKSLFDEFSGDILPNMSFSILSMGMSGDYKAALKSGSNLVRIGSLLFGPRVYS